MGGQVKSYDVPHLSRQIILANLQISSSKMQPVSRDQRPGLTPCLTHVSLVLRPPRGLHLSRSASNAPSLPSCLKLLQNPQMFGSLWTSCIIRGACHTKRRTSKSGPNMMWCFENFDLEICFAPQQRALLKHVKVLGEWCVLYIWLRHFCFAQQWRGFVSTSQLPSVLRGWGVFHLLTWKRASCHNSQRSLFEHFNFQKLSETEVFSACWLQNLLRATAACNLLSHICPDGSAPAASASLLFDPPLP